MRRSRITFLAALIVAVIAIAGFIIWAETPLPAMPEAIVALNSDSHVQVNSSRWLVFQSLGEQRPIGFIFYPGGRVDPRAYAPPVRQIAEEGYLSVIVPMPLNLAVLAPDSASEVIKAYPEIHTWIIGGHSLGGSMAAQFVYNHPLVVKGLVLWASYPPSGNNLTAYDLKVVSIYGVLDGVLNFGDLEASRSLLPPDTTWIAIQGGNHAQFGWYGPQPGDNSASISRESQQSQAVQVVLILIDEVAG